jgi:HEAT repeat protein
MMKRREIALIVAALCGIAFIVYFALRNHGSHAETEHTGVPINTGGPSDNPVAREHDAENFAKMGIMSKNDYLRLAQLQDKANAQGRLSDQEIAWAAALMKAPSQAPPLAHLPILALFASLKQITPKQEETIFQATLPSLASNDMGKDDLYMEANAALDLMEKLKDHRAIPYLLPLLKNPNAKVRAKAKRVLAELGYSAS